MGTVQNRKVSGQGAVVTYTLIRKQVKNINLSVKSNGEVIVSAHRRVPEDYIDDFVRSKIPFIMRAMERLKEQAGSAVDRAAPKRRAYGFIAQSGRGSGLSQRRLSVYLCGPAAGAGVCLPAL